MSGIDEGFVGKKILIEESYLASVRDSEFELGELGESESEGSLHLQVVPIINEEANDNVEELVESLKIEILQEKDPRLEEEKEKEESKSKDVELESSQVSIKDDPTQNVDAVVEQNEEVSETDLQLEINQPKEAVNDVFGAEVREEKEELNIELRSENKESIVSPPEGRESVVSDDVASPPTETRAPLLNNIGRNAFEGQSIKVQLTFHNVDVHSKPTKQKPSQLILQNVSGSVMPGRFMAIIGASGAGKTTFLSYISGKLFAKNLVGKGDILFNGVPKDKIDYYRFTAFVQQEDILLESMTVRECLMFAAEMKAAGDKATKKQRVDDLLYDLGLKDVAERLIGGSLSAGVSKSEIKRTSIGVEIITNPSLIFLDEPTTGVDSITAAKIVDILVLLARRGHTVVATIHQPNSEIFHKFDELMIMALGKVIYLNKACLAVDYFNTLGFRCSEHANPAEFFMSITTPEAVEFNISQSLSGESDEDELDILHKKYEQRVNKMATDYEESDLKCDCQEVYMGRTKLTGQSIKNKFVASWCKQYGLICKRDLLHYKRLKAGFVAPIMMMINISIWTLLLYWQLEDEGFEAIQNRTGVLFFISTGITMAAIQNNMLIFPEQRAVFMRDQASSLYSVSAYFAGKITSQLPNQLIVPSIYVCLCYHGVGLNTEEDWKFPIAIFVGFLAYLSSGGYAVMFGALIPDRNVLASLIPILNIPMMLLGGYFVNLDNITVVLWPIQYVSTFKYAMGGLAENEFTDMSIYDVQTMNGTTREVEITDTARDQLALEFTVWECILAMFCLYVIFNAIALIFLKRGSRRLTS